ncbi:carbon-nitrogen hydrolase [Pyronema omphalodes]|nr:carbon-nitrogen hydrolase [Pyronema omphalodes]
MRIGCLQLNPKLGCVTQNLQEASKLLHDAAPKDLDLLVLPEMAFTGYNFSSISDIKPFLEPTAAGPSTTWAFTTAKKLNCHVIVGYPEQANGEERYNSAVLVSPTGDVVQNYRKSFLFTADEKWAQEGPGFWTGEVGKLGKMAMGICMDLNPKNFTAPPDKYEFGHHVTNTDSKLAVVPMAWLTHEKASTLTSHPDVPDGDTLRYWIQRMRPVYYQKGETIFVTCNRTGIEEGVTFAGSSCVVGLGDGAAKVYGVLGRGREGLLVVDTGKPEDVEK